VLCVFTNVVIRCIDWRFMLNNSNSSSWVTPNTLRTSEQGVRNNHGHYIPYKHSISLKLWKIDKNCFTFDCFIVIISACQVVITLFGLCHIVQENINSFSVKLKPSRDFWIDVIVLERSCWNSCCFQTRETFIPLSDGPWIFSFANESSILIVSIFNSGYVKQGKQAVLFSWHILLSDKQIRCRKPLGKIKVLQASYAGFLKRSPRPHLGATSRGLP